MSEEDGRRIRGDRTRRRVARRAAELASAEGLSELSLGRLAGDLGLSKSSVAAAYGTKQQLQLAAVAAAQEIFVERVVSAAAEKAPGLAGLRALIDAWFAYVDDRVFPGGCFMVAAVPEFDSRPGPVRDALARSRRGWLALLTRQVAAAQRAGALTDLSAPQLAFEIDALLAAANTARNLFDDPKALTTARRILRARLGVS